LSKNKSFGN